uniref:Transcriptional regulator, AraC family n=1 Tax=uncultured Thiotrichaceae bacterium TaxID=298394 RepID=A0A6S6T8G2_9GAMM|nr:MAG: Transcriptional regulator, AraC family [uncultured Thiotrichaceae bacterium]
MIPQTSMIPRNATRHQVSSLENIIAFLAILLSGFSVFSAIILSLTHFRSDQYAEQPVARSMGMVLLMALLVLQFMHADALFNQTGLFNPPLYLFILFAIAPAFYLFSRPLLFGTHDFSMRRSVHFLPAVVAPFLPFSWAMPLAFAVGAIYLLFLTRGVWALREQRERFRIELVVLAVVFFIALLVLVLGFLLPLVSEQLFFSLYAIAVGCAFVLVNIALNYAPQIPEQVSEAARETYATSTLAQVDCEAVLVQLASLMEQGQIYKDSQLGLNSLAQRLDITSHQLSELINTRLGKSFSRYLREYRVGAAENMLLAEPSASVLSVGLSVGFTSQSNFYEAFREISGTTPGKYRKLQQ